MAPDVDATAGTPKGWYDLEAVLAEKPVAALLATYLAHDAGRRAEAAHLAAHAEAFCLRVRQGLEQADFGRKRELLELLIDCVVVTGEAVEIRYAIPVRPEGESGPFCLLRTDYQNRLSNSCGRRRWPAAAEAEAAAGGS